MMMGGMKVMKLFGFCKQEMKHSTKMLWLTCDSRSWVALQYSLSWRLHHCLLTLNLPVCPLGSIAVRSVAKPHQPWRVYDHMTQKEYCRNAMQWVAEKHQPVESLDRDPEDIDIDQHHENFTDADVPFEINPQVELSPDLRQSTSPEGQTQEAPNRRARVEEMRMRRQGSRVDGLKAFQVVRENGVIRHRVTFRSCMPNSRGKDYCHGHHSKMKKSGSWLSSWCWIWARMQLTSS